LRIGLVTDRKIIKKYKAKYGSLYFPEGSYSSLVIKRNDGQIFHYDFLVDTLPLTFWINK